jgi:hypothetical protein
MADTLKKSGKHAEALEVPRRGHAIMVRLAALSRDNAIWKHDREWFEGQIAELSR